MQVIISHVNADFDSLAAMVAAQKIYTAAKLVFSGSQNRNVKDFISLHGEVLDFVDIRQIDKKAIERLIVVDTRIADRLGEFEDLIDKPRIGIIVYDHHPSTEEDLKPTHDYSEITGATTTILVKIIRKKKIEISPFEATLFALGIHEDTGSLTYPTTTPNDAEAIAYLMTKKANVHVINQFLNRVLTEVQHKLLSDLLKTAHLVNVNGVDILFAYADAEDYIDGASVVTYKLGDLENAEVVFNFIRIGDRINIIGRSKIDEVDVGLILSRFEGGGHPQAASAVVKTRDLRKIEQELIEVLKVSVRKPLVAQEIMSKPVRTIDVKTTIQEASKALLKFGHTGLPVVDKGKLMGMISRRDLDKAVRHGLSHAPVKGFMSHQVITVSPEAPLHEMQKLLVEEGIGRLPVASDGKIIGIVTRTDLLRALHGDDYLSEFKSESKISKFTRKEIVEKFEQLLPKNIRKLLKNLGIMADKFDQNAYLVGGFVRDVLMGYPNLDIDIVVEGDGISFTREVVKKFGGRTRAHKKFGTAVVIFPDGFRIDFSTARTEFYEKPGALPQVEFSSIRQDLYRRDFSINAMAFALNSSKFGQVLDFFGGKKDLKNKQIRVLHNLSFVEDPTRIFRAVRFEQRYGFQMTKHTEELARRAVETELIGELTTVRIRDELIPILSEDTAWFALKRLFKLGALAHLHPRIKIDLTLKKLFEQIRVANLELEPYFSKKTRLWITYLMALLRDLTVEEINEWSKRMKLKKLDALNLEEGVSMISGAAEELGKKLKNSELYFLLKNLSQEQLILFYAISKKEERTKIIRFLRELKSIKPTINGNKLIELGFQPSPLFGKVLHDLLCARLDGLVKTEEDEINLTKKMMKEI